MKTFFRSDMNVPNSRSFSPSAGKPQEFISYLLKHNIILDIEGSFNHLTRQELSMAHEEKMVNDILDLKRDNGFGNRSLMVAKSLPFTSGSFYAAAEWAIRHHTIAFSPTSGFHHAGYNRTAGFCTFNGLMVSALKLKKHGYANTIGIIDIDNHYGDGTENIIYNLNIDWIKHYTFGGLGICPKNAEKWLNDFELSLDDFKDVDIIFYQAGADTHVDDPLGGALSSDQMRRRDELVFETFKRWEIPVVWCLAGGYQKPLERVLELHKTTYEIALTHSRKY